MRSRGCVTFSVSKALGDGTDGELQVSLISSSMRTLPVWLFSRNLFSLDFLELVLLHQGCGHVVWAFVNFQCKPGRDAERKGDSYTSPVLTGWRRDVAENPV